MIDTVLNKQRPGRYLYIIVYVISTVHVNVHISAFYSPGINLYIYIYI